MFLFSTSRRGVGDLYKLSLAKAMSHPATYIEGLPTLISTALEDGRECQGAPVQVSMATGPLRPVTELNLEWLIVPVRQVDTTYSTSQSMYNRCS